MSKKVLAYSVSKDEDIVESSPRIELVEDYKDMQKIVGGPIEILNIPIVIEGQYYDVFVNEEGKLNQLALPGIILLSDDEPVELVVCDFFVSKADKEGETISLTDVEIEKIKEYVEENSGSYFIEPVGECKVLELHYD